MPRSILLHASIALALGVPAAACILLAHPVQAQRTAVSRTVMGRVTGKDDAALKGAIVHLKDVRSLSQKSFITPEDGEFRFGQLSPNSDYEIWAEFDGKKSAVKQISSFESKNSFTLSLKIDK